MDHPVYKQAFKVDRASIPPLPAEPSEDVDEDLQTQRLRRQARAEHEELLKASDDGLVAIPLWLIILRMVLILVVFIVLHWMTTTYVRFVYPT